MTSADATECGSLPASLAGSDRTASLCTALGAQRHLRLRQVGQPMDHFLEPDIKTLARFVNDATPDLGINIGRRRAGELTLQCLTRIATALDVSAAQLLQDATTATAPATTGARPTLAHVRLLHSIATNPRAMVTISRTQYELPLPGPMRDGLVAVDEGQVVLH